MLYWRRNGDHDPFESSSMWNIQMNLNCLDFPVITLDGVGVLRMQLWMHDRCHPPVYGKCFIWFAKQSRHSIFVGFRIDTQPSNLGTLSQLSKQSGNRVLRRLQVKTSTLCPMRSIMLCSNRLVITWVHCLDHQCFPPGHIRSPRGLRRQLTMFHIQSCLRGCALHAWHMLRSIKYKGHYATH